MISSVLSLLALGAASPFGAPLTDDVVVVQAGLIHTVSGPAIVDGSMVVDGGKIVALGADLEVPAGARVVDYGPDAVIVPGLVCADSSYGASAASPRTASPTLRAIDNFDPYAPILAPLRAGITSIYMTPARGRLLAGQGAVVKTHGDPGDARILSGSALLQGSITEEARRTPGFWEPPVPATVDVGLGVEQPQLPRSTMGAVVALGELLALQSGDDGLVAEYGLDTQEGLKDAVERGLTWRMAADTAEEVRALLDFFAAAKLPLALEGSLGGPGVVEAIATAGVPVFAAPPYRGGQDFGKGPEAAWPEYDVISRLAQAGVRVAICPRNPNAPQELWLDAGLAMRGGMSVEEALRAITLTPAELLGVADRVGSLAPGKDADFVVLSGPPLSGTTGVTATWVDGDVGWKPKEGASTATVIEVDELHVGDGEVLRPGQILVRGSRIVEVGARVSHPRGAVVVRGAAAMPGLIDTYGYLGLEGSEKGFSTRFDLKRIVEPGDETDRHVARLGGVTTVNLGSRRDSNGAPTLAYKPAGSDYDTMIVASPATLRLQWSNQIRAASGEAVRKELEKAVEYKQKWEDYAKELAEWDPSKAEADDEKDEDKEGEDGEESEDEAEDDKKADDDKDDKKKSKDDDEPRPVTGEWNGTAKVGEAETAIRVRLLERDLKLEGTARLAGRDELIVLEGSREEGAVTLRGLVVGGYANASLTWEKGALNGTWTEGGVTSELALERTSEEYPVAGRPVRLDPEPEPEPKGKPKEPGIDPDLEPLRQAMMGKGSIVVTVGRDDEILECVEAFAAVGIKPVLWGASGAGAVASRIRGRIAGVITRSNLVGLASAGIPVAFYSQAEEGAVELSLQAIDAIADGMSPDRALGALTAHAADLLGVGHRVGRLAPGLHADVVLLDGPPLEPATSILRVWVSGEEID